MLVLKRDADSKRLKYKWVCQCDCGNIISVSGYDLRRNHSKSCGCLKHDGLANPSYKHGLSGTKLYSSWTNTQRRCTDKTDKHYKNYGGRGIVICKEWDDFKIFADWALNNGFKEGLTIDRIDNDGNYEPSNCRWVDRITQQNHRRVNQILEFNGVKHTLTEWSRIVGLNPGTIRSRIRLGWQNNFLS